MQGHTGKYKWLRDVSANATLQLNYTSNLTIFSSELKKDDVRLKDR
jgi:hypothetical protein